MSAMKHLFFATIGVIFFLQPGPVVDAALAAQAAPDETHDHQPEPLTLEDYGRWSTIGEVALSGDGRWMTFALKPNEGDARLFLRDLDRLDQEARELTVNGSRPEFSDDSRWLAFVSRPGEGGEGDGRGPSGGGDVPDRSRTLHLQDLRDPVGEAWVVENPSSYFFSDDSR